MSDPIRDLENFSTGGPPITPLPAAEVRRRGDRLRRRNTTLLAAGAALAAAVAIGTPFALAGGGADRGVREPGFASNSASPSVTTSAKADGAWLTTIPEDFPLDADLPATNDDGSPVVVDDDISGSTFAWCAGDEVDTGADRLDEAVVKVAVPDADQSRVLQVYSHDAAARAALTAVRTAVQGCPTQTVDGAERTLTPFPLAAGDAAFGWTDQGADNGSGLVGQVVWQAVRVGNALLIDSSYGEAMAGDPGPTAGHPAVQRAADVVEAMKVFAAPPDARPADPGGGAPDTDEGIPASFPLARGLVSPEGDPLDGPGAEAAGIPQTVLCGSTIWPAGGAARRAVTATGPEFQESRELVRYADEQAAVDALSGLRAGVQDCPAEQTSDGVARKLYELRTSPGGSGSESVTFTMTYDSHLGGAAWQFTRVGSAVLGVYTSGEYSPETMDPAVDDVSAVTDRLTPAMCAFTASGC